MKLPAKKSVTPDVLGDYKKSVWDGVKLPDDRRPIDLSQTIVEPPHFPLSEFPQEGEEKSESKLISPSDLRREAQRLIAEGKMPTLEKVLRAFAEARQEFGPALEGCSGERIPGGAMTLP